MPIETLSVGESEKEIKGRGDGVNIKYNNNFWFISL